MEIQADPIAAVVSLLAAAISVYFFLQSKRLTQSIQEEERRIQKSIFHFDRTVSYIEKIYDCPECLKFYGINPDDLVKDDVTPGQVAYLAQSITAMLAQSRAEQLDIPKYIEGNEYRKWIFQQPETVKVWKFVRLIFSDDVQSSLDPYLKVQVVSEI